MPAPKARWTGKYIAVDFDGTCVAHEYPRIGRDVGAVPVLQDLVKEGAKLILFTMRSGKELDDAVGWFADNEIALYGINSNPTQKHWTTSPKAYAHLYIDDAGLGTPILQGLKGERPFVDWRSVRSMLLPDILEQEE